MNPCFMNSTFAVAMQQSRRYLGTEDRRLYTWRLVRVSLTDPTAPGSTPPVTYPRGWQVRVGGGVVEHAQPVVGDLVGVVALHLQQPRKTSIRGCATISPCSKTAGRSSGFVPMSYVASRRDQAFAARTRRESPSSCGGRRGVRLPGLPRPAAPHCGAGWTRDRARCSVCPKLDYRQNLSGRFIPFHLCLLPLPIRGCPRAPKARPCAACEARRPGPGGGSLVL